MKRFLGLVLVLILCLGTFVPGFLSQEAWAAEEQVITIFHTNDQHGRMIQDNNNGVIGIDTVAAIHKSVPHSLLVDAGDVLHGLPFATLNKGADVIALMNQAGYAYMVTGNHDFNYGYARLLTLRQQADFKILTSNVKKDGAVLLDNMDIQDIEGVKVGFFGLALEKTGNITMPDYVRGLTFEDAVATAKDCIQDLKAQGAQVIVAITHLGVEPNGGTTSPDLAQQAPGIDVIVDGHSHTPLPQGMMVGHTLIAQAGNYEQYVGQVTLGLEDGKVVSKTAKLIDAREAKAYQPDKEVADGIVAIESGQLPVLETKIGVANVTLSSERAPGVRTQEMPLGTLVAEAYRQSAGAEIAIANGGDIREDLKAGDITKGEVISILPFGNNLQVKLVTPAILKAALENGVSGIVLNAQGKIDQEKSAQGRFPQIAGFQFTYDPQRPVGERVLAMVLDNGKSLALDDSKTQITLAGSNYVMSGGDYYTMLGELPVYRELGAADEAFATYLAAHSPVLAPAIGRIQVTIDSLQPAGTVPTRDVMALGFLAAIQNCSIISQGLSYHTAL